MSAPPATSRSIADLLARALGGGWRLTPLGASAFCTTWCAESTAAPAGRLFVKTLPLDAAETDGVDVLATEADGLHALARTATIRVPTVAGWGRDEGTSLAWLAMSWLDRVTADASFGARFGAALGQLHATTAQAASRFGWHAHNLIGATPQLNGWSKAGGQRGWIEFYGTQRLGAMRSRLARQGAAGALLAAVDGVIAALPSFFDDGHEPRPSLIHGDLWSGNWAMLDDGAPVIFDPAVSQSDAEAELAMMELFGSPPAGFWPAYRAVTGGPAPGYAQRRALYQLYHLLNHTLLFGGTYAHQSLEQARRLAGRRP